ncbi:MAG TPA: hypothetical protein VG123_40580 [Streptosporangiaceae bacterium]|jgi:hypothetical protein|nr:hypothetical protein [Streptosporangiaceae bacterium]
MAAAIAQVTPLPARLGGAPGPLASEPERAPLAAVGHLPAAAVPERPAPPELPALPGLPALPVLPALAGLLPDGLRRGTVVTAGSWGLLCLALAAGASAAGAWCAVVGVPQLGVPAAAGLGVEPSRMLLVAEPGPGWPQVVASLLDGCEVVLLRAPGRAPPPQIRRRLAAALRRSSGVLVVAGEWAGAQDRLAVTQQEWTGIGAGHGRLRVRRVRVVAEGRGAAARPRAQWLWLPGPDGSVAADGEPAVGGQRACAGHQAMSG